MKDARKLDVVLHSATRLKKVSTSRMAVYAVAWIDPCVRVPSPMDKRHGTNPVWNATITIALDERTLSGPGKYLNIELLGQGLVSTKPIGFVSVNVSDILSEGSKGAGVRAQFLGHPVRRRSGREQGTLDFELHLQECPTLLAIQESIPKYFTSEPKPSPPVPQQVSNITARVSPPQVQQFSYQDPQYELDDGDFRDNSWKPRKFGDANYQDLPQSYVPIVYASHPHPPNQEAHHLLGSAY